MGKISKLKSGFTIVELLVVIVVIGILAAITLISYTSISKKAASASALSDLGNATQQLMSHQVVYGAYPSTIDCGMADSSTNKCLKASPGNSYEYYYDNTQSPPKFSLIVANNIYSYRNSTGGGAPAATLDPAIRVTGLSSSLPSAVSWGPTFVPVTGTLIYSAYIEKTVSGVKVYSLSSSQTSQIANGTHSLIKYRFDTIGGNNYIVRSKFVGSDNATTIVRWKRYYASSSYIESWDWGPTADDGWTIGEPAFLFS